MKNTKKDLIQDTNSPLPTSRIVSVKFDRYTIKVKVGDSNEFLGIVEIGISQDFRSIKQKNKSRGGHDVSDLYEIDE